MICPTAQIELSLQIAQRGAQELVDAGNRRTDATRPGGLLGQYLVDAHLRHWPANLSWLKP